jgi:hypothetical protein
LRALRIRLLADDLGRSFPALRQLRSDEEAGRMTCFEVFFVEGEPQESEGFNSPPWTVSLRREGFSAESSDLNVFIPWPRIRRVEEWDE